MAQLNIEKLSLSSKDREKEEQKKIYRRKSLLVLIHHYLKEYGYIQAADVLKSEVNFNLKLYTVCDNIHMESIIQDFESYYFLKYQKLPQIMKKVPEDTVNKIVNYKAKNCRFLGNLKMPHHLRNNSIDVGELMGKNKFKIADETQFPGKIIGESNEHIFGPLGSLENCSSDWKSMAELILQDMQVRANICWNEIIGHDRAKELLKEAIVYPLKYQELFSSSVSSWRSILLYGPSGTGKTLLASAAASESGATLFKICLSTIISKWRGESEKLIKVLFVLAKQYAPSIIFLDEIDALLSHRGEDHEASRRMKTELFMQLDTLFCSDKLVLVLSATNIPWQLDYAILRRLEKRVLISYPDEDCRIQLFKKFLPQSVKIMEDFDMKMDLDYLKMAEVTQNYSASDIETFCKEAKMNYIRQVIEVLEHKPSVSGSFLRAMIEPLNTNDVLQTVNKVKPTASELSEKYEAWKQKHGSE